ncbi:hypothetical protein BFW01_g10274 [Lasiodiplodia theobromae]|uniref:Ecp2 effector protein domain-containing protein n=2 Tax=Lasiodiplodia TaxID=66739 RepID=A0A5N5D5R9_9PEZI|nr:uncharacterized protein LTHEOB_10971 [Lasiodiplodia theobromae]KAB2572704.1 hypothetical protein DBV05_g8629 [Lasiodiplodia theobromae]KAF4538201.1 hypothetical protein LTHEOB_10971 [Lasiodiplodia theobromae]KAF9629071.1 hypothetical protein BFW01_g10274 [Lasiodiplodia theobromae]KAK0653674.1 hypothetical protein DIS24_g5868 [Lasiodiplodia hormozganensis]
MKFFSSAITAAVFGLTVSSAVAAPTNSDASLDIEKRVDCVANAAIIRKWSEDALTRYRVAFSITRQDIDSDTFGQSCSEFGGDAITRCSAINNNIACYHSAADQSWVVDNNQVAGVGDSVEDCVIAAFRDKLASKWGCHV